MSHNNFHRDNHYVPRVYLKAWESTSGRVNVYRVLVSHKNVPLWKEKSIRRLASQAHIYTRSTPGGNTDDIEKWFDREYETPAAEVLGKVLHNRRLETSDWRILVRFLALQDLRTPARLMEHLQIFSNSLQGILQDTLEESVYKFQAQKACGEELHTPPPPLADYFPFRLTTEIQPGQELGTIKAESACGRASWLYTIKHSLTSSNTIKVLQQHRWTIITPPEGTEWFTSDNPVVRLNFHNYGKYDFGGGWGSNGTQIFMPIGPRHLLYTQIGSRPPRRGTKISHEQARIIRRCIAEHAHRFIFSSKPDAGVPNLRHRTVNAELLNNEKVQWSKWHQENAEVERKLIEGNQGKQQVELKQSSVKTDNE